MLEHLIFKPSDFQRASKHVNVLWTVGVFWLLFLWQNVKRAHCFKAARNTRLGPCNITKIIEWDYPSQQGHFLKKKKRENTTSCLKVRRFYNIHQQQRLRVLQQDCFHMKNVQKQTISTRHPHSLRDPGWIPCQFFFSFNNLTKPVSPHTSCTTM